MVAPIKHTNFYKKKTNNLDIFGYGYQDILTQ